MARNRGGGSSSRARQPAARAAPAPAPAPSHVPQAQAQHYQPAVPSAGGVALGSGSAMGHMAVNSMFGGSSTREQHQPEPAQQQQQQQPRPVTGACQFPQQEQLNQCLQQTGYNASACQPYFDALRQCQEQHQPSGF
ncbi:hypothetical protein BASA81_006709 [Batrachochytrium salamandrivorans]|nr:hypothetical protein BASA81_006709 [Batrachochytrium salamandrivorans]